MLYARALSITWAENPIYWKWVQQKEASGTMTELAELKRVCWLEVEGKFDTTKLSPGILYQVSFIVMLKNGANEGWEIPINVRLEIPGGKKQEHKENLLEKSRESWVEIPVGEFVASEKDVGEMKIFMYEYEGGMWKTGLIIKGIVIKPKN
uniref:Protein PHLOEM PROTEIN 2-LIKE A1 n=2 Tax=Cajanus cajan TaxID=3821 RepID=A0A151UAT5_CAJCA|nr:Protein PHLOEM PROTEIN 2-LIKE A1 [Cajanus cajan]